MSRRKPCFLIAILTLCSLPPRRCFLFPASNLRPGLAPAGPSREQLHRDRPHVHLRHAATTMQVVPPPVSTESASEVAQDGGPNPWAQTELDDLTCARGVCVVDDRSLEMAMEGAAATEEGPAASGGWSWGYLWPRLLLGGCSVLYGTNFPLGRMMNDSIPPSAATAARMFLAMAVLSPWLFRLDRSIRQQACLCGCFTALGYITQSLSLVDTPAATVAFLGAATVVICPSLEALVDKKPMTLSQAPHTWLAGVLCLSGVAVLELAGGEAGSFSAPGLGDGLALLQAVGFGTSFYLTEKMMSRLPDQALPITATQVAVAALLSGVWCLGDSWLAAPGAASYALPGLLLNGATPVAAAAVLWTGLATTAANRFAETTALGKMSSAEASVILATEPLWAALFAALLLKETFGPNDYVGGLLIIAACLANTLKPEQLRGLVGWETVEVTVEVGDTEE